MDVVALLKKGHVVAAQQFELDWLEKFFYISGCMEKYQKTDCLVRKEMVSFFYEESTRTRASFEMAMKKCGGDVVFSTENARKFSSVAKGETLEDTIRVLCSYKPDVIVLRYDKEGGAQRAVNVSSVPIINAGDGSGQHPTQALLDMYTIKKELGIIDGISIAMVGDLRRGRTVRSLCYLLGKYQDIKIHLVSPYVLRMKDDIKEYLTRHQVKFSETLSLKEVAPLVDVIYQTRVQTERTEEEISPEELHLKDFVIDTNIVRSMKKKSIVMHPLPKKKEITTEVDLDPRAAYFRQAENGLYCRMALLKMILSEKY